MKTGESNEENEDGKERAVACIYSRHWKGHECLKVSHAASEWKIDKTVKSDERAQ